MEVVLVATSVERMKETVTMMINVRKVTNVELTIAKFHWVSILNLTAAIVCKKIFAHLKIPVVWIKGIVIHMMFAREHLFVD